MGLAFRKESASRVGDSPQPGHSIGGVSPQVIVGLIRYRPMELGLVNKVAMVGGASKGLGFAVARALAAEGAHVSIASRDEDGDRARRGSDQCRRRRSSAGRAG